MEMVWEGFITKTAQMVIYRVDFFKAAVMPARVCEREVNVDSVKINIVSLMGHYKLL